MDMARSNAGFTLVEVLVGVALFALIASIGLGMLGAVARVRAGTQGELDAIAALQRAEVLLTDDLVTARASSLEFSEHDLRFQRQSRSGRWVSVSYTLSDGVLLRQVGNSTQPLLQAVSDWRWRVFDGADWQLAPGIAPDTHITAVEITLVAPDHNQIVLRRIVRLPEGPVS